jgi:hypothetical protein
MSENHIYVDKSQEGLETFGLNVLSAASSNVNNSAKSNSVVNKISSDLANSKQS